MAPVDTSPEAIAWADMAPEALTSMLADPFDVEPPLAMRILAGLLAFSIRFGPRDPTALAWVLARVMTSEVLGPLDAAPFEMASAGLLPAMDPAVCAEAAPAMRRQAASAEVTLNTIYFPLIDGRQERWVGKGEAI